MKETVEIVILLILVVVSGVFVTMTKGNDELNWDINLNLSWPTEDEFSYSIVSSDYNGEFRNNKGNGIFALMGKNEDGTYRIYFIHQVASVKNILVKIDSGKAENDRIAFTNANGTPLYVVLGNDSITVGADLGYGDAQLEGYYAKMKSISVFSMSEFEYFNY